MYTVNFKKCLGISVVLAAMLLSGCQKKTESSQGESSNVSSVQPEENSSAPAESSVTSSTKPTGSSSTPAESSTVSSAKPVESSSAPAEEDPPYGEPPDTFPAGRIYPDDKLVPDEWLRVDSAAEFTERIAEAMVSDTTVKDPEEAVKALLDRNLFFICLFLGDGMFEVDWDSPYDSPDFEKPIYPITSKYFSDIQSINDLAYDTYKYSVAEEFLHAIGGEPLFTEINGQMYVNITRFGAIGGPAPFTARSYIEIFEKTENKCAFVWHYPDVEMLNPPESGYEFYYYEQTYIAEYIDGSWKLNEFVKNF